MGYFDNEKNVGEYIKMAEGYDGSFLIEVLKQHLAEGSTVLELGMGPGKDLDILGKSYRTTGSDSSQVFLELYRKEHAGADLLHMDAVDLGTERKFDCIYSNKVLIHLTTTELKKSLEKQAQILKAPGMIMHSFWFGDKEDEEYQGLRFVYYTESELTDIFNTSYQIIEMHRYKEMKKNDSVYVLASFL